jgi:PIN domain nuclease of toxin-antitoxin system
MRILSLLPMAPGRWYEDVLRFHHITEIQIDGRIAVRSTELPKLHADPCDRLIIATAQLRDLVILTSDALIGDHGEYEVALRGGVRLKLSRSYRDVLERLTEG